jgi:hypothetical protein
MFPYMGQQYNYNYIQIYSCNMIYNISKNEDLLTQSMNNLHYTMLVYRMDHYINNSNYTRTSNNHSYKVVINYFILITYTLPN